MAERGALFIRTLTNPLVSRTGFNTGLPTGNTESSTDLSFYYESVNENYNEDITIHSLSNVDYERAAQSSFSKSFNVGFIGQETPTLFNIEGGGGGGGPTITTYYKMRGYYVAGSVYETWVVTEAPSITPPSGHTLSNVVIISTWQVSS